MSTVTKSIGTSGRDYSTITAWEADLDNAAVYASGNHAVGECYNDSVFDESVTLNGGGTIGLASVTLTVAVGQRHSGTAGTGTRVVITTATSIFAWGAAATVDWLELNENSNASYVCYVNNSQAVIRKCIIHGGNSIASPSGAVYMRAGGTVLDSILYNNSLTATGADIIGRAGVPMVVCNTTVLAVRTGVTFIDHANTAIVNVLSIAGSVVAFNPASPASAVAHHNLSSDATASGTGSLINKAAANQFVSTVAGSEDLHLKAGSDAIDAGTDLGTTPTGVNIDIDGRDRDAEDDVWDIGADEYVNPVARFPWQVRRERRMAGAR